MYSDKKASMVSTQRKLENLRTIPYGQITDHVGPAGYNVLNI